MTTLQRLVARIALLAAVMVLAYCVFVATHGRHREIEAPVLVPVAGRRVAGRAMGARQARAVPFVLVEFADYECPACRRSRAAVAAAIESSLGRVGYDYRHMPLPMHSLALPAARAAEAARLQGRFWPMHEMLMSGSQPPSAAYVDSCVRRLGLNHARFASDLATRAARAVQRDMDLAKELGLRGTPAYLLCMPDGRVVRLGALAQLNGVISGSLLPRPQRGTGGTRAQPVGTLLTGGSAPH